MHFSPSNFSLEKIQTNDKTKINEPRNISIVLQFCFSSVHSRNNYSIRGFFFRHRPKIVVFRTNVKKTKSYEIAITFVLSPSFQNSFEKAKIRCFENKATGRKLLLFRFFFFTFVRNTEKTNYYFWTMAEKTSGGFRPFAFVSKQRIRNGEDYYYFGGGGGGRVLKHERSRYFGSERR